MPFPEIKITGNETLIGFNITNRFDMPADGSPLVLAFDVPPWRWTPWSWSPPRRSILVSTSFQSNTGIYGPNPPTISGIYGEVSGPANGVYGEYYNIKRVLYPGRHYLVVRAETGTSAPGSGSVAII